MVSLYLKKDEVARGQKDQILCLDKIKFEVELNSYIGGIHKIISIGKRSEWKQHLVSIVNQIHLKIGQEEEKNCEISNLSRKLKY